MPKLSDLQKVMVIGSGPIVIGQGAEFDYAGTQACLALKEEGIEVILVNNNPATIMTDESIADHVYVEALNVETLEKIIEKERPDGLIGTLGGQTGLNLTVQLHENGILEKNGVRLLGTSVESIQNGEDRERFRNLMLQIGEPIPESKIIENITEGMEFAQQIGYPLIVRPAYTLGGAGGGFASTNEELEAILKKGLALSPIHQVLVERSIKGWKEIEYEVMRDMNDTCIIICNMENIDPVGVHTGDSIVVAPTQTLTDEQHQMLRDASLKVIRALNVVGGCNIQFALNPYSNEYYIIEVNPRVSRSSALASKATGYPIAKIATKCALGYYLDEMLHPMIKGAYASFEPALDYVVVKIPRFPFDKFSEGDRILGTQMKATGEVMAMDRTFEGALNKALRSLETKAHSLSLAWMEGKSTSELEDLLKTPNDLRIFAIAEAFRRGYSLEKVQVYTEINEWFLSKIKKIVDYEQQIGTYSFENISYELLLLGKEMNISDRRLAEILAVSEKEIREKLKDWNIVRVYKYVDTCAGEYNAVTPYYYSTFTGMDEVDVGQEKEKILVIGSGPIRIGQGIEFDYCSVHAANAVKKKGYEAIVINNNPETVSTDYTVADKLYFEPLTVEDILAVAEKEQITAALIQFGGQTAINVAEALEEAGIKILGTSIEAVNSLEDREQFYGLLKRLNIPHIAGKMVHELKELEEAAQTLQYPVLIRPSYVIGGQSMFICNNKQEVDKYLQRLKDEANEQCWPLLVDQYLPGLECEMDLVSDGKNIYIPGIFEHVEKAGVHSGDSIALFPPMNLDEKTKQLLVEYGERIAKSLPIIGIMNIQFVIHDDTVYVLEVNPRASRTVPIISKVTGVPLIELATNVQLGEPLSDQVDALGLLAEPNYFSAKAPIFSASKLNGVDHVLGPEMKSTGEVLGIGLTREEALAKALQLTDDPLYEQEEKPILFCSIADWAKRESLPVIQQLINKGFQIIATEGTAIFLQEHEISCKSCEKEKQSIAEMWKKYGPTIVLNIASEGRNNEKVGFYIRELAVRFDIPYFTSLETIIPYLQTWIGNNKAVQTPRPLKEYYARNRLKKEVKI